MEPEYVTKCIPRHSFLTRQLDRGRRSRRRSIDCDGYSQRRIDGYSGEGESVNVSASNIWRIKNGKVTDIWHVEDLAGMMVQLGAAKAAGT